MEKVHLLVALGGLIVVVVCTVYFVLRHRHKNASSGRVEVAVPGANGDHAAGSGQSDATPRTADAAAALLPAEATRGAGGSDAGASDHAENTAAAKPPPAPVLRQVNVPLVKVLLRGHPDLSLGQIWERYPEVRDGCSWEAYEEVATEALESIRRQPRGRGVTFDAKDSVALMSPMVQSTAQPPAGGDAGNDDDMRLGGSSTSGGDAQAQGARGGGGGVNELAPDVAQAWKHANQSCAIDTDWPPREWHKYKMLGAGSFGEVWQGIRPDDGRAFAVKIMALKDELADKEINKLMREVHAMADLQHNLIVQYYGCTYDPEMHLLNIFMEYVEGGSIGGLVRKLKEPLSLPTAQRYIAQVLEGVAFLHDQKYIHRDIKGDNILLKTTKGICKISDFGTCKRLHEFKGTLAAPAATQARTMIGTPLWMAPEVISKGPDSKDGYGYSADVWSIGCVMVEMINRGQPPWPPFPNNWKAILTIGGWKEELPPEIPKGVPELLLDFLRKCFAPNPDERWTCKQLLQHRFITEIKPQARAAQQLLLDEITDMIGTRSPFRRNKAPGAQGGGVVQPPAARPKPAAKAPVSCLKTTSTLDRNAGVLRKSDFMARNQARAGAGAGALSPPKRAGGGGRVDAPAHGGDPFACVETMEEDDDYDGGGGGGNPFACIETVDDSDPLAGGGGAGGGARGAGAANGYANPFQGCETIDEDDAEATGVVPSPHARLHEPQGRGGSRGGGGFGGNPFIGIETVDEDTDPPPRPIAPRGLTNRNKGTTGAGGIGKAQSTFGLHDNDGYGSDVRANGGGNPFACVETVDEDDIAVQAPPRRGGGGDDGAGVYSNPFACIETVDEDDAGPVVRRPPPQRSPRGRGAVGNPFVGVETVDEDDLPPVRARPSGGVGGAVANPFVGVETIDEPDGVVPPARQAPAPKQFGGLQLGGGGVGLKPNPLQPHAVPVKRAGPAAALLGHVGGGGKQAPTGSTAATAARKPSAPLTHSLLLQKPAAGQPTVLGGRGGTRGGVNSLLLTKQPPPPREGQGTML